MPSCAGTLGYPVFCIIFSVGTLASRKTLSCYLCRTLAHTFFAIVQHLLARAFFVVPYSNILLFSRAIVPCINSCAGGAGLCGTMPWSSFTVPYISQNFRYSGPSHPDTCRCAPVIMCTAVPPFVALTFKQPGCSANIEPDDNRGNFYMALKVGKP